jgi:hypothetical protein
MYLIAKEQTTTTFAVHNNITIFKSITTSKQQAEQTTE